ncbi:sigma-54-dependent transcriptional regulator [Criblamydia sequanensis]|uniref:Sigma-54 dependent response regulator n=1 Tax=Candidatus Criblamydia sequanensis CRIB-18 TaxID=1437425 RepID=A0A090DVG9_9BACT|nr:sigma-54 dependent transcriptional regulator [Criblamydia sequanensis]CDR32984.1 sigma-54 dependent response regulator [Criblamydia sequanensis CRIB-18]
MAIEKILIVDDELLLRNFLAETLRRKHYEVATAENGEQGIAKFQEEGYDLVITDMRMPDLTGIDVLKKIKSLNPKTIVIVVTAYGSIENAVEAMKLGAFNYLIKPFTPDTIEAVIEKAKEHSQLLDENHFLREEVAKSPFSGPFKFIAESPIMKKIYQDILRVAKSNASIFISGESGTGKEIVAAAIHQHSLRSDKPFIKVNCAAIPESLIESEFFGHEKGSFTGAHARRTGRFELANHGTLLLDEITEVPPLLQPKLLRALQEQEFERIGGVKPVKVDVRVISTSNRNIRQAIASKQIREDLYYRLNVIPIQLPPLRDRKEDILPLSEYFVEKFCAESHLKKKTFSDRAKAKLQSYRWPGNVRELANIIERAVVMYPDAVIDSDALLLDPVLASQETPSLERIKEGQNLPVGMTLGELEKLLIIETLDQNKQNRKKTAEVLDISVRTLRNKLNKYKKESE